MSRYYIALLAILCSLTQAFGNEEVYSIEDTYPFERTSNCPYRRLKNGRSKPHKSFYEPNAFVEYICDEGYKLDGLPSSGCIDGNWITEVPFCKKIEIESKPTTCRPRAVKNGVAIPNKVSYAIGNRVGYKCLDGYVRVGTPISMCMKGGVWSADIPQCEEKPKEETKFCSYRNLEYGSSYPERTAYKDRSVVIYRCKEGFELRGENAAACFDGDWTVGLPICEKIKMKCPYRPLPHGIVTPEKDFYEELAVVVYACNDGYELRGSGASACFDGSWTTGPPVCEASKIFPKPEVYCLSPSFPRGSYKPLPKSDKKYAPGSFITFRCNGAYNIEGSRTSQCLDSGKWDQIPVCEAGCRKPKIANGFYKTEVKLSGLYFEPGHTIFFHCSPSYKLRGATSAVCQSNGRWGVSLPRCEKWIVTVKEVGCPSPVFPHGTYAPMLSEGKTEYSVGDRVIFTCEDMYRTKGINYATCLSSGQWTAIPSCSDECVPPTVYNGRITPEASSYKSNSKITLSCDKGYLAVGKSYATCLPSGAWSANLRCSDGCYAPKIARMTITPLPTAGGQVYEFGHRIRFKCDAGFSTGAVREAECRGQNKWDKTLPKCHALTATTGCPMPVLSDGLLLKTQHQKVFQYKAQLEFDCGKGYRMVGSAVSICRKHLRGLYGGLDPSPPVCHRVKCGSPGKPQNGRFRDGQKDAYYFGDTVYFVCDDKHVMSGNDHITCNANGQFTSQPPKCQPPSCRVECKYVNTRHCQCDASCRIRKDCCHDFEQHCRKLFY